MNAVEIKQAIFVPLFVVDEAVKRIKDGSFTDYVYDPQAAQLVKAAKPASKGRPEL